MFQRRLIATALAAILTLAVAAPAFAGTVTETLTVNGTSECVGLPRIDQLRLGRRRHRRPPPSTLPSPSTATSPWTSTISGTDFTGPSHRCQVDPPGQHDQPVRHARGWHRGPVLCLRLGAVQRLERVADGLGRRHQLRRARPARSGPGEHGRGQLLGHDHLPVLSLIDHGPARPGRPRGPVTACACPLERIGGRAHARRPSQPGAARL